VPTHTTRKLDALAHDREFLNDPRLKYIPGPLKMLWRDDAQRMVERRGEYGGQIYTDTFSKGLQLTGEAHRAGVPILAGTDTPDSFVFPGSSLHDELEHLTMAGLSPLEALRSATIEPARFLGLEFVAGELIPGARADVVLVRSNPLDDLSHIRHPETVILAGAVYNRTDLDRMLQQTEKNAGHWSMWPKFAWQILNSPIMLRQFAD
jgi:hypothetical protein